MNLNYKTVSYPIEVPKGKYCWEWDGECPAICEHFDNSETLNGECTLGFSPIGWEDFKGHTKPKECLQLVEIK